MKGKLFIAGPYSEDTIAGISAHFKKLLNTDVTFTIKQDKSLLGGFLAIVDGKLYDSSVLARLKRLQQHLFTKE